MGVLNEKDYMYQSVGLRYPHIRLFEVLEITPLIITLLEKGNTPIILSKDGDDYEVDNVRLCAGNISKLIRTHKRILLVDKEEQYTIDSCKQFIEVMIDNGYVDNVTPSDSDITL